MEVWVLGIEKVVLESRVTPSRSRVVPGRSVHRAFHSSGGRSGISRCEASLLFGGVLWHGFIANEGKSKLVSAGCSGFHGGREV